MARIRKKVGSGKDASPTHVESSAPHNHLYLPLPIEEARLVTILLRAGEQLAVPLRECTGEPAEISFASAQPPAVPDAAGEASALLELVTQMQAWASEPQRKQLLSQVRSAFADGWLLHQLCRALFSASAPAGVQDQKGDPILSNREIEVLREAAADRTYVEIGARLGISKRTVDRHFDNIYKQLGVHRPLQAVARAMTAGYLDIDALTLIHSAANVPIGGFSTFGTLVNSANNLDNSPNAEAIKSVGEIGLLMLALTGLASGIVREEVIASPGVICKISAGGKVEHAFGAEFLNNPRAIMAAPSHSAQGGFTPGNLFVAISLRDYQGMNRGAIAEVTPAGRHVRSFCGSKEIGTRLYCTNSLVFASDGRLLAGTSHAPDGILAFSANGNRARRFVNTNAMQICVGPNGAIYVTQRSSTGCIIRVFDQRGKPLRNVGGTPAGVDYYGLAVNSRDDVYVNRQAVNESVLEHYNAAGELQRETAVPGFVDRQMAVDAEDRLYLPFARSQHIHVVSSEGKLLKEIDLRGHVTPRSMAFDKNGSLWVCGPPA